MKKFEDAKAEIVRFPEEDVITTSGLNTPYVPTYAWNPLIFEEETEE